MELKDTQAFINDCIHDEPSSCSCACPFSLDVRSFLKKMARGRFSAAYRELAESILFPSVAAELCPQPCGARCQRISTGDEPVDIRALERACISFASNEKGAKFPIPPKQERIAVVGAGPAGLACALPLARKKYNVTVFDRNDAWGGSLRNEAQFALFENDFSKQFGTQEVDFRFGVTADEKMLEGYDAVFIATGDNGEDFGLASSWDSELYTT
ncbi:MAG: FAD-dependent oxidoreductase, partial [Oscillospiraceae bacterium]|nr:FAD-dependent oxidoreductase [Oscillospiraceae bacterium]